MKHITQQGSLRFPIISLLAITLFLAIIKTGFANEPVKTLKNTGPTKIFRMISKDFINIDGNYYKIPPPWRGNKQTIKPLTFDDFALIPPESTWQQSKLYLLKDAQKALVAMIEKAREDGIILIAHSAYRSKEYQFTIFRKMMDEGRSFTDIIRYVAPPGYSEHMLGTVVDFYPSNWSFAESEVYNWLQVNAQNFGFSESYPRVGNTGVPWEPWHWRYIHPTSPKNGEDKPVQQ